MASDTSRVVISGDIIIEVTKFLAKSWQQRFCVLHRKTNKEHADICIYDSKDDFYNKPKKTSKKIVLENVKYIHKSMKQFKENKEYLLEFKCGREKQILKFLNQEDLDNWEFRLNENVDICADGAEERSSASVNEDSASDGNYTENIMYDRTEQAISFDIKIDENDSAKRCHLKGNYNIHISSTGVGLLDNKQNVVYSWPYSFIRRYGVENNKNVFVIEVGRKCNSGEGQFRFQTRKAQEIHDLVTSRSLQMQRSQNPMTVLAPLIPHQVCMRQGSTVSEDSEESPQLQMKTQPSVSSPKNGTHNSWVGSNNNTEADKLSATDMKKSGKKSPDVIPRVHAADKMSGNGSEADRRSVTHVSHNLSHVLPNFQKELEEKLNKDHKLLEAKAENHEVQNITEDEQNDTRQSKKKTRKDEKRESDKEKKKKEGEKDNSKKWSLFSKKSKENERIKSSERDIKSDSTSSNQKPQHLNQSSRFYEEVDIPERVADTQSTGLYSEPFEHIKNKKKLTSKKSNEGKVPPPVAKKPQELYSEPVMEVNAPNIYSEAVKAGESADSVVYSEAFKVRQDAWKNYGEAEKFHDEDYMNIQAAREMQKQSANEPPLPPRPSDFDDDDDNDDDDGTYAGESYYNKLDFERKMPNFKSKPAGQGHIYGTSSGPVGPLPEQNYDSVSSGEEEEDEEEEEDQYAEADINPQDAYEEAKPKPPQPKPLLTKSQKSPPPESLYEDI
ncbi:hypothetical protein CHS0354_041120 [Potamilus streckersoni]|uniref:IRS-type PTB domain-containing protein n=1 Tax=Potamilus streckersoni TaxID=2493646 RepID=A0AAE0SDI9_9BIVA|nr:hypothetical protein CHS0354_041120 [Potamilus streckersoni]